MSKKILLRISLSIFSIIIKATAQDTLTNEETFFKAIYQKYPTSYFQFGSDTTFAEIYDNQRDRLVFKFSFMIIDSNRSDKKKYLQEINDPALSKYLPSTHFYVGKHTHHYELGHQVKFIGCVNNQDADFVLDTTTNGFTENFENLISGVRIPSRIEREKFTDVLLSTLTPILVAISDDTKTRKKTVWTRNQLTTTHEFYHENILQCRIKLYTGFDGDRISYIYRKTT